MTSFSEKKREAKKHGISKALGKYVHKDVRMPHKFDDAGKKTARHFMGMSK